MSTSKAGIFFFTASENLENSVLAFSFNTCDFWICCRVCQITGRHYFYSILHLICLIFQESEWKFFYKNLFIYIAKMSWRLIISDVDTRFIDSFRFFNIIPSSPVDTLVQHHYLSNKLFNLHCCVFHTNKKPQFMDTFSTKKS